MSVSNRPLAYVGPRTLKSYRWKKKQSTSDWVEQNVYLSPEASPLAGRVNLKYTPHLREMFDDYDKRHVWKQMARMSTQTGKTMWLIWSMAKRLDTKPTKLQYAIPNEDKVTEYIEDKIDPVVKGIPSLQEKVEDHKQTEKARLKRTRVKVPGGDCIFTGSSASSKRSKTVREIRMDEADLMSDGSIIEFEGRTKASEKFGRKVLAASSQKKKNGEIAKGYKSCETKKEWHTPCPRCEHHWLAGSKDLKWQSIEDYQKEKGVAEADFTAYKAAAIRTAHLECPECGHHIKTKDKDDGILAGKYKFYVVAGPHDGDTIGYRANALAMYFTTFETIVGLLIDAEMNGTFDDTAQIYLDYFDEIYEPEVETADKNDILTLGNGLDAKTVPKGTYRLYLTLDTQKDGFWFKVTAFQYGFIANTVHYGFVSTFDEVELLIKYRFPKEEGGEHIVDKILWDRMGIPERTAEVDAFIEYMVTTYGMEGLIYPTMGIPSDPSGRLWFKTTLTKDITTGERRKTPIEAIKVNNLLVKNELQNLIDRTIKKVRGEEGYANAKSRLFYINQDIVNDAELRERSISTDYERQMTSETYSYMVDRKTGKASTKKTWNKIHNTVDNHIWDCSVLAVVAALMDNAALAQAPKHDELESAMGILGL